MAAVCFFFFSPGSPDAGSLKPSAAVGNHGLSEEPAAADGGWWKVYGCDGRWPITDPLEAITTPPSHRPRENGPTLVAPTLEALCGSLPCKVGGVTAIALHASTPRVDPTQSALLFG